MYVPGVTILHSTEEETKVWMVGNWFQDSREKTAKSSPSPLAPPRVLLSRGTQDGPRNPSFSSLSVLASDLHSIPWFEPLARKC